MFSALSQSYTECTVSFNYSQISMVKSTGFVRYLWSLWIIDSVCVCVLVKL